MAFLFQPWIPWKFSISSHGLPSDLRSNNYQWPMSYFQGSGQYERFNIIFLEIVGHPKYRQIFITLGMPPEDFGTHSIRKGAVTFGATGCTTCPPITSICLRDNWAMPGVMNHYIKYESPGDQFTGKFVSGRSRMSTEFAISPHILILLVVMKLRGSIMRIGLIIGLRLECRWQPSQMRRCLACLECV